MHYHYVTNFNAQAVVKVCMLTYYCNHWSSREHWFTAKAFAKERASIMLVELDTTTDKMKEICLELAYGTRSKWVTCDVMNADKLATC